MKKFKLQMIPLIDCCGLPNEVIEALCDDYDYSTHYDHDVLQISDDGGIVAEWLKANGYVFIYDKSSCIGFDLIAFYGT